MDFGFNDEKFKGESTVVPYAQFINPVRCSYFGVAIRESCVEAAGFIPTSSWMEVNHSFKGAKQPEKLLLCTNPRLVILHRSKPYMSNGSEVTLFDAGRRNRRRSKVRATKCSLELKSPDGMLLSVSISQINSPVF